jgi:signal transduction histidine kinase
VLEAFSEQPFEETSADVHGASAKHKTRDVQTDRLRATHILELQLDDIEAILNVIPVPIGIAADPSCTHVTANEALARLLSISSDTNISQLGPHAHTLPFRFVRDGVPVPVEELPLYRAAALGRYCTAEHDIEFDDGRYITVQQSARPLYDKKGKIRGSICTTTDVTQQRRESRAAKFLVRANEILGSSLALETTLNSLARHVVPEFADSITIDLIDDTGTFERVATRLVDPRSPNIQVHPTNTFALNDFPEHPAHEVIRTGIPFFADHREGPIPERLTHRPEILDILQGMCLTSVIIVPVEVRGRMLGVMCLSTTDRRRSFDRQDLSMVTELARRTATAIDNARLLSVAERLREESERANRAKSDFLAAMSHELRTPLNAIAGYCQLLLMGLRGQLTPEQREDLERIAQNQHHLLGLINSILNYTKLDAGVVQYDTQNISVVTVLQSVEPVILPQIEARGLHFQREVFNGEVYVHADADKLRQILLNLTINAIKFTPFGGTITIGYRIVNNHVHIYVSDTGVGIAPEKLDRIFDPFVQVDRTLSTIHEGVGLGLAISRDLARGMGGDLTVRSEVGKGSTFTIVLPQS